MRKLAVITSKGGTGKTTTAVNLAHGLALCGMKVLVVDCDPQRNAALIFDVQGKRTLCDLLQYGHVDVVEARKNLFVIDSGGRDLAEIEMVLRRDDPAFVQRFDKRSPTPRRRHVWVILAIMVVSAVAAVAAALGGPGMAVVVVTVILSIAVPFGLWRRRAKP